MKTTSHSSVTLLGVKSAFSLFVLFIITVVIHEGSHYVTLLIFSIPIAHFAWFDTNYFAPSFFPASTEHSVGMTIVGYSGGLVTGVLLLSILILKRKWFKQSVYKWLLGLYIVTFGFWQICQGILEGAFHQTYISNATNLLFSSTHYVGYASAFLGMASYWLYMPCIKKLKI